MQQTKSIPEDTILKNIKLMEKFGINFVEVDGKRYKREGNKVVEITAYDNGQRKWKTYEATGKKLLP